MLSLVICVGAADCPVSAQKIMNETEEKMEAISNKDCAENERTYEYENYNVKMSLEASWQTGYNAKIKVKNTGDTVISNWYLSFIIMMRLPIFGMQRLSRMKRIIIL